MALTTEYMGGGFNIGLGTWLVRTQIQQILSEKGFVIEDWGQRQWRAKFWHALALKDRYPTV